MCVNADMRQGAYLLPNDRRRTPAGRPGHPTRLAALRVLHDGREHCVCELMRQLGASQSRMSRHMATLRQVGLVTDRRDAQSVRYRLDPTLPPAVRHLLDAALELPAARQRIAA
ncbi:ArsR/SmtB family transcription factor [Falsiroseomonas sp.]|uniref:ArsR/SmtB family transcription factor n=1 Tax=Falsiroseomonas sp. TaxID=2870721 RepID=UPI00356946D8